MTANIKNIKHQHTIWLRPAYDEVDQMGYIYHAHYVKYCHQARTELMRTLGIPDRILEDKGIILPVIKMNLRYHQPAYYDCPLMITAVIDEISETRLYVRFEIKNEDSKLVCKAESTLVFVDKISRKPIRIPEFILDAMRETEIKPMTVNQTNI